MAELQFSIEQNLRYEDAVEAMFDLLDFFEESDSFDEIEWDEEEDVAFVANEDLEVEIVLGEGHIDVFAEIFAPDLTRNMIRRNLTEDIETYFGVSRRPPSRRRQRDWREEGAFERAPRRRELDEEAPRSRGTSPGRFGRPRELEETGTERRSRSRGGARRLRGKRLGGTPGGKAEPKVLPFSKKPEERVEGLLEEKTTTPAAPAAEKPAERTPVVEPKPVEKAPEPKPEPKVEERAEAREVKSAEEVEAEVRKEKLIAEARKEKAEALRKAEEARKERTEEKAEAESRKERAEKIAAGPKPGAGERGPGKVAKAEPQVPVEEASSGGGKWFFFILLLIAIGFVLFYLSPWWPNK